MSTRTFHRNWSDRLQFSTALSNQKRQRMKRILVDVCNSSSDEEELPEKKPRKRETIPRCMQPVPDYSQSVWAKMLKDPSIKEPTSKTAKKFRRRFRVPFPLFELLVAELRDDVTGAWDQVDATRLASRRVPLELKVLSALRALGRGEVFDTLEELTLVSESTLRVFYHKWTA